MLPLCGYDMGDYFAHWLDIGRSAYAAKLPRIYFVDWFRKDESGRFLWPGFGENSRVLNWIIDGSPATPRQPPAGSGRIPARDPLDIDGLDIDQDDLNLLLSVDTETWKQEATPISQHLRTFSGHTCPASGSSPDSGLMFQYADEKRAVLQFGLLYGLIAGGQLTSSVSHVATYQLRYAARSDQENA